MRQGKSHLYRGRTLRFPCGLGLAGRKETSMMMSQVRGTVSFTTDHGLYCPEESQRHILVPELRKHFPNFHLFMIFDRHTLGISMMFIISAINLAIHID